ARWRKSCSKAIHAFERFPIPAVAREVPVPLGTPAGGMLHLNRRKLRSRAGPRARGGLAKLRFAGTCRVQIACDSRAGGNSV
ncbi:hypothetical protein, partial [uncultured Rikenella sp.]|uniref:hypothetical protein n=1 Tax=uncultured Rikenella sp. TaxID=368003 RepID=UPI00260441A1